MTIREFLDAGFFLLVNEFREKAGMTLFEALEHLSDWASGGSAIASTAAANDTAAALSAFQRELR